MSLVDKQRRVFAHLKNNVWPGLTTVKETLINRIISMTSFNENLNLPARFPTMEEIATNIWENKHCTCLDAVPRSDSIEILGKLITFMKTDDVSCGHVICVYEYISLTGNKEPTKEELLEYSRQRRIFIQDPEEYHSTHKVLIGVDISTFIATSKEKNQCGLCHQEIAADTEVYKLPCSHVFHKKSEECIDDNVSTWFDVNVKCPLCKVDLRDV
jgi:hypothetical protein